VSAPIQIGTCSWADESLTKYWYPRGVRSAEERLRYYASHFSTVEVDSTYYRLPDPDVVARWDERTPPGFAFHIKAFGMMTRHPVKLEVLPADLQGAVAADERGRVDRPPREVRAEVFARFRAALEPLRAAGKLRGVLMQFPSYIVPRAASFEYLEWASEQLDGDPMLVEFRHRDWLDDEHRAETLAFLEGLGASFVVTDSPRTEAKNLVPTVVATTSPTAYVRFHGRNAGTWNVRGRSAAERFDYLYAPEELVEWVGPLRELGEAAEEAYAFFNNNGRSPGAGAPTLEGMEPPEEWVAQAATNAVMLRGVLEGEGVPVV